jgi:hypothetical protein
MVELVLMGIYKQVVGEKGQLYLSLLSVLPYPEGWYHGEENFITQFGKNPANLIFRAGTKVKYIPFLFT